MNNQSRMNPPSQNKFKSFISNRFTHLALVAILFGGGGFFGGTLFAKNQKPDMSQMQKNGFPSGNGGNMPQGGGGQMGTPPDQNGDNSGSTDSGSQTENSGDSTSGATSDAESASVITSGDDTQSNFY